jgi:hypothetical protein
MHNDRPWHGEDYNYSIGATFTSRIFAFKRSQVKLVTLSGPEELMAGMKGSRIILRARRHVAAYDPVILLPPLTEPCLLLLLLLLLIRLRRLV